MALSPRSGPEKKLVKMQFRPGFNTELSRYAGEPGWYTGDKVRFRYGLPEKIGGSEDSSGGNTFSGVARAIHGWSDLSGSKYLALGTTTNLYVWQGGTFTDITPIRAITTITNGVNTSVGDSQVIVSLDGHGAIDGAHVIISNTSVTVGGNVVLGTITSATGTEYVVSLIDANSFAVSYVSAADATSVNAGGDIVASFIINQGEGSAIEQIGWGAGAWGDETWGTPRDLVVITQPTKWSLANWGENLVANRGGSLIYIYDVSVGGRATPIAAAPTVVDNILISPEDRFMLAFGATDELGTYDPMLVRWASQEDYNDWTASATNTAGSKRLSGSGSRIVGALASRNQTLIWTDIALYSMQAIPSDLVFGVLQIGKNCGLIGSKAAAEIEGRTFWMSQDGFYMYDGSLRTIKCPLHTEVYSNINLEQGEKVFCTTNADFNEVMWLYQSNASSDIDKYIIYNYVEDVWYSGTYDRTCWLDKKLFYKPMSATLDGRLLYQESGVDEDGSPMEAYIESADFDLGDGDQIMFLDRIIPDFVRGAGCNVRIKFKKYPGDTYSTKGPFMASSTTDKIDFRARGRQAALRVDVSTLGSDFRLGAFRTRVRPDGET